MREARDRSRLVVATMSATSKPTSSPEFTAEELGRMSEEKLREIRHCELCLEPYHRCQCREGRRRREEAEDE